MQVAEIVYAGGIAFEKGFGNGSVKRRNTASLLLALLTLALYCLGGCTKTPEQPENTDALTEDISLGETTGEGTKIMEKREVTVEPVNTSEKTGFAPLAIGQVRAESWLKTQLLLQASQVTGQFEQLSPDCKAEGDDRSGWLGGSGESWERGTYYVRGLVATAYVANDSSLIEKARKWIDWTLESQTESGAFGPYADDNTKFDWWPLMPMLIALEQYADATGDTRVVPFLKKYFAYQQATLPTRPLSDWGQARGGDNILAVYWLYEKTKDESLLKLCDLLYKQTFNWDAAYDEKAWSETYHIVNVQESFKLFPLMYALTGEQKYLDTYYTGIENLYMACGRQDGMSNGDELTRGIFATYGSETCAVVERMLCDEIALYITRDANIADHLELVAYNAFPQQLLPDGTGQVYFTMQNQIGAAMGGHGFTSDGGDRSVYGLPGGYPCCAHNYQMGWPLFIASMWMSSGDGGVAVGAYGPCEVSATVGNGTHLTLTEDTDYPFEETVTLNIKADAADTYPVYLRIPDWCDMSTVGFTVNGYDVELTGISAGSYFRVCAEWHDGDVLTLVFPPQFRVALAESNSVSVRYGALLFALAIDEKWKPVSYNPMKWNLTANFKSYNITAASDWNYALSDFDFDNIGSNFTVERVKITDDMRFTQECAPVILYAEGVKITEWKTVSSTGNAQPVPPSPVQAEALSGATVRLRLLPYAFSRLRITVMPWTGTHTVLWQTERTDDGTLISRGVTGINQNALGGNKNAISDTSLALSFDFPTGTEVTLTVNRKAERTLTVSAGRSSLSVDVPHFREDYYNFIEFKGEIPDGASISFTVETTVSDNVRYQAENAKLTGSAYAQDDHVAGIDDTGSSLTFEKLMFGADGTYTFRFYFAAPLGRATHTLFLDGVRVSQVGYNTNGVSLGWGCFSREIYTDVTLDVSRGMHTLRLEKTDADTGFAELDCFDVIAVEIKPHEPSEKIRLEAEKGAVSGGAYISGDHIAGIDKEGDGVSVTFSSENALDACRVRVYYTAPMGDATHTLCLDGEAVASIKYSGTETGWGQFEATNCADIIIDIPTGTHTISLIRKADDTGFAEIDAIELTR